MGRQFQFVAVSNQTGSVPAEERKSAHSHAIRQTHANQRRLRMQKYQKEVMQTQSGNSLALVKPSVAPLNKMINHGKDVFSALPRTLSSQEYFLLDHCMSTDAHALLPHGSSLRPGRIVLSRPHSLFPVSNSAADLHICVPIAAKHCDLFRGQLLREWVDLALANKDLLDTGILLNACRSILHTRPGDQTLMQMALFYRQKGLQGLRHEIDRVLSSVTILTIAKAVALVMDEVATGRVETAVQHLKAMYMMAKVGVDPKSDGLSGLLAQAFFKFSDPKMLGDETIIARCSNRPIGLQLMDPDHCMYAEAQMS